MMAVVETAAPLSLAQERFLLVNRLGGDVPLHNSPVGWRIRGPLDTDLLARALEFLADRHSVLRTRFPILDDGSGAQEILPDWRPRLQLVALPGGTDSARAKSLREWKRATAARPFKLTEEPAFRASLARLGPEDHALLLVFHHIAFDGWSYGVVVRDLGAAYTAFQAGGEPNLPPLRQEYGDYAVAQREWVGSEEADRQRQRWAKILAGVPAELELPTDRRRPLQRGHRVERLRYEIGADVRVALERFATANRATPFLILMAALQAMIGRYTDREDFVIGFPLANRKDRADLSDLVGCFINILLLRADLSGEPTFLELVRRVKRAAFEAFPYQKLPFDEVVKIIKPIRGLSQVMFDYRDYSNPPLRLGGLACEDLEYEPGTSAVELSLDVIAFKEGPLTLFFEYSCDLFDRSTIERLAADYEGVLREGITVPDRHLKDMNHPRLATKGEPVGEPESEIGREPVDRGRPTDGASLSEVEGVLLPIWEEALGLTGIGTRDDFFELGGQSLQAVHLIAAAERALSRRIPLGWILNYPTIGAMARAIEKRSLGAEMGAEFLIPMSAGGSLSPLFCIHGGGGGVFAFREVANLMGPEQPVYGIKLVGSPLERVPRSVEAMAERYMEEIRRVQPEGPYRLLGYSFGSLVAYEMARRLAASGESVELIGLVVPPRKLPALRPVWRRLRKRKIQKIQARRRHEPSISAICSAAAYRYRPLPYPGPIVLFQADEAKGGGERLWRGLARGGLDVRTVPGGHLTILKGDNAPEIARELRSLLGNSPRPESTPPR